MSEPVEPTFIRTRCAECTQPVAIETTHVSAELAAAAAKTASDWLCDHCYEIWEQGQKSERNRDAAVRAREEHRTAVQRSKVPPLPRRFELPTGPAADAALRWAHRRTRILTLFGPVGTGKSTLARWAFMQRLEPVVLDGEIRARQGAWRFMAAYITQLGASFGTPEKDDAVWLSQGGIVLGLDDLDKTGPSEFAASAVYALVNSAYETRGPLIVTMNAHPAELAARWPGHWGRSIVSRLMEGDVVELAGADRRMAALPPSRPSGPACIWEEQPGPNATHPRTTRTPTPENP